MGQRISGRDLEALGGMATMNMLLYWPAVEIEIKSPGDWHHAMACLEMDINAFVAGRFWLLLDREDELTNLVAYFVVHCENESDAVKLVNHLKGATRRPTRTLQPPEPMPEWLKRLASKET
jgi:hypothetical protein